MTDYLRDADDFDLSAALVDNNQKIALDGAIANLQPDEDNFGSVINDWLETQLSGSRSYVEAGGIQKVEDPDTSAFQTIHCRNILTYLDADLVAYWSDTKAAVKAYVGLTDFVLSRDNNTFSNNSVLLRYRNRSASGAQFIQVYKIINTASTKLFEGYSSTYNPFYFRIKRLITNGPSNNYFYFYTSTDGSSWSLRYSGQVRDATYFNETHELYLINGVYSEANIEVFEPELSHYYQYTGDIAAQRFWPDSPECNVIDSASGAVEYVVDVGVGNLFYGTGFAATTTESGAHVPKWKMGYGDAADRASATFDGTWRDEAALTALVAAGTFDGHRYLFLKQQHVSSDGSFRVGVTDVTISGVAPSSSHTLSQSNAEAYEGVFSFKHVGPVGAQSDKHIYQYITVTPGEEYYVGARCYCKVAPDVGNFYLQAYDETGAALIKEAQIAAITTGWRTVGFYFTAPASCIKVSVRVGGDVEGGTIHWDLAKAFRTSIKEYA